MSCMIAIDGGGTKTDLVLFRQDGTVLSRVYTEGCNPNDFGWKHTENVLKKGLDHLLGSCGGRDNTFQSVFAGVSGGSVGKNKQRMQHIFHGLLPHAQNLCCASDAVNAMSSGIGHADGCVVISGTGSSGFVRRAGQVTRVGGWGYLFDKGGSGYDLGRDAVYYAACAADGRGPQTILKEQIEQQMMLPFELAVTRLYEKGKPAIAALAPLVFEAAHKNDACALQILQSNGQEQAKLLNALSALAKQDRCQTVLAGSVFCQWDTMQAYVLGHLERKHDFIFPKLPPVYGSAVEAAALAGITEDASFRNTFQESLEACPVNRC